MKTLYKYHLSVDGMRCGMCEIHVEEHISKRIYDAKIIANRNKKQVVIISKKPIDEKALTSCLKDSGYYFGGILDQQIVQKKTLFERLFKKK